MFRSSACSWEIYIPNTEILSSPQACMITAGESTMNYYQICIHSGENVLSN
jgi:hypothetical protein